MIKWGLVVVIILAISTIVMIEMTLQPILNRVTTADVTGMLSAVINKSANQVMYDVNYNQLVNVKTNDEGYIVLMQPNLQQINNLASDITLNIQKRLEEVKKRVIEIPVSQVFGIEILSKFSPTFDVHVIPYGAVKTNVIDEFEAVGINQTKHRIYLHVTTQARVVVPAISTKIKVSTDIPLSEAVISGEVPRTYVGIKGGLLEKDTLTTK
ncbi:sporulation protein YunB [Halobacteroides halobius DSM 5150]|uniref:Sporulation protein YunB n=1 Tax=Halobacteroides halobius (strain ATCC 35273 / DSM 5150 / MD-1) TaxID=748449 RepID=L0KC67_HALHC|nr:sporulation protein YunB [Halobacteroides halobius DSM 5150]